MYVDRGSHAIQSGELTDLFLTHDAAKTYLSMPACGALTGGRLLGELGDDPSRFAAAKGLRAYASVAPLTWESGSSRLVTHRRICNWRLKRSATGGRSRR